MIYNNVILLDLKYFILTTILSFTCNVTLEAQKTPIELEGLINVTSDEIDDSGKFIFLDFWATWCKPCLQTHPHIEQLHASFMDDVIFLGISKRQLRCPLMSKCVVTSVVPCTAFKHRR